LSARSSSSAVVPAISPIAPTLAMTPAVLARLVHVEGVVSVLERLVRERGAPQSILIDNGSEFYSRRTDSWAYRAGVRLDFSRPG